MQDLQLYTLNQFGALILSIILGAGVYIVVVVQDKKIELTKRFVVFTLIVSAFVTHVAGQVVLYFERERLFSITTLVAAFLAQWIVEQVKLKFPKIFDSALKKAGLDINNSGDETDNINQEAAGGDGYHSDSGGDIGVDRPEGEADN